MGDRRATAGNDGAGRGAAASSGRGTGPPDEMEVLGPGAQEFVEGMGLYYERLGIPRIGGRILGLLMLVERPLTLDDMARALKVSRASISTNARVNVAVGMVEHVSLPGDRRDYYVFSRDAWTRRIEIAFPFFDQMRRLAERGLATLDPANAAARVRLHEAIEFCDFYRRESEESIARWKQRTADRDGALGAAVGRSNG